MEPAIQFQEKQEKIYLGKNKITKSSFGELYVDLHIVEQPNEESGYSHSVTKYNSATKSNETTIIHEKFVRVIAFENVYSTETIKEEIQNGLQNMMYFENGGYYYIKNQF